MPENMPKSSVLTVANHFQNAPSFLSMYQHLFICHLRPTDFQQPLPRLCFRCFKKQEVNLCLLITSHAS